MNRRWLIVSLSAVTALATLAVRPSATSGQSLHLAELFAERGRIPDARAEVLAWFEIRGDEATPNEMQHGLWLRGRFAEDPAAGAADLERLVEDYPEGPYTGLALGWPRPRPRPAMSPEPRRSIRESLRAIRIPRSPIRRAIGCAPGESRSRRRKQPVTPVRLRLRCPVGIRARWLHRPTPHSDERPARRLRPTRLLPIHSSCPPRPPTRSRHRRRRPTR